MNDSPGGQLIAFPPPDLTPARRCVTRSPVPLLDAHGRQVRVVAPRVMGWVVEEYAIPSITPSRPPRPRAKVRFDDDQSAVWDVARELIWVFDAAD